MRLAEQVQTFKDSGLAGLQDIIRGGEIIEIPLENSWPQMKLCSQYT